GALLALSVTNSCRLPVELPDLFFRWLLLGGESATVKHKHGQQLSPSCHAFEPSVEDMVALDKSLERPFEALKDAVQSEDALKGLLEIEGLPADTSAADYITYMVRQTFLEPVQWQMSEVREAFFRTLLPSAPQGQLEEFASGAGGHVFGSTSSTLLNVLPRPPVLAEIIRGKSPAFWSVVQIELSPEERRRLLLFITGTDRLPEAGCETLSIEVLFVA
ncbi:unnamed protein product, partial [Ectocarpus sp. 12 AP-2014]